MLTDKDTKTAAFRIILATAEAIRDAGSIPSGHLYAAMNSKGITLDAYNTILAALKDAKLVSEQGHLLTWIG